MFCLQWWAVYICVSWNIYQHESNWSLYFRSQMQFSMYMGLAIKTTRCGSSRVVVLAEHQCDIQLTDNKLTTSTLPWLSTYPGFCTASRSVLTASSLLMFSKLTPFTSNIMSPGSTRPSCATAPLSERERVYKDLKHVFHN